MKAIAWYAPLDSTIRFDAAHYLPDLSDNHSKLKSVNGRELRYFVHPKTGLTGGSTPLGASYPDHGIRFIRTQDYGPEGINIDQCVFIDAEHDPQNARSRLSVDDVLLSITGVNFGESAVVTTECLPANISQHSVRIRLDDTESLDPYWLAAFFNSSHGHKETLRQSVGFIRPALDYGALRDAFVPSPRMSIQRAIGNKVRAAEKLRRRAEILARAAIAEVEALIEGKLDESECLEVGRKLADEFGFEKP